MLLKGLVIVIKSLRIADFKGMYMNFIFMRLNFVKIVGRCSFAGHFVEHVCEP